MSNTAKTATPPAPPIGARTNGKEVSSWVNDGFGFNDAAEGGGAVTVTVKLSVFTGTPGPATIATIVADPALLGLNTTVDVPVVSVVSLPFGRAGGAKTVVVLLEVLVVALVAEAVDVEVEFDAGLA
jgi:hypothetical protein